MGKKKVGSLFVGVSASTGAVDVSMKRGAASVEQFAARLRGVGSRVAPRMTAALGSLAAGINPLTAALVAAGVAAAGLGTAMLAARSVIRRAFAEFEGIDAAAKLADQLGMTTEALAALRHAAELSGAGNEIEKALEVMSKRIGEATWKSSEATAALRQLGLSATGLANLGTEGAFTAIAERIARIGNASLRASVTAGIFGRGSMKLVNMLAQGRAGLEASRREIRRFGGDLDRYASAGVERARDEMYRFGAAVQAAWKQAAAAVGPSTAAIYQQLTAAIQGVGPAVAKARPLIEQFLAGAIAGTQALTRQMINLGKVVLFVGDVFTRGGALGPIGKLATGIDAAAIASLRDGLTSIEDAVTASDWSVDFTNRLNEIDRAMRAAGGGGMTTMVERWEAMREAAVKAHEASVKSAQSIRQSLETPLEKAQRRIAEIERLHRAGYLGDRERMAAGAQVREEYFRPEIERRKAEMEKRAAEMQRQADARAADAERIRESLKSPMQRLQEEIRGIQELWKTGDLGWGEAAEAIRRRRHEFFEGMAQGERERRREPTQIAAAAAGTSGFATALAAAWNRRTDPQMQEQRRQTRLLERIERAVAGEPRMLNLAGG
jgi:hypothetical protein